MQTKIGTQRGSSGAKLQTIVWSPDIGETAHADVVLVHGYGEHSGRYVPVAEKLTTAGFRVSALDHRGHGRSTGVKRGEVDSFEALVDDLSRFVDSIRSDVPLFVYGHSMGGLATVRLAERGDTHFAGLILTGPAMATAESIPKPLVAAANVIGLLAPWLPTIALDGNAISRDEAVRLDYDADPLNYRGKLTARTGREINMAMASAMRDASLISAPMLILHGGADALAAPEGSRRLSTAVSSEDVTHREWAGAYHELHHEPEKEEVIALIISWIESHVRKS